jgi:DNA-binding SARP family transcriptional activator
VEFRVLGPLEFLPADRPVVLGGPKDRILLAVLLLQANLVVPVQRLIDALWDDPPVSARKNVQTHVWGLRRLFAARLGDERIESTAAGYRLRVAEGELDLDRFDRLAAEGQRALAGGDPALAAQLLQEALALWRGAPLLDVPLPVGYQGQLVSLEERRLAATEDRVEAALRLGRDGALVGELRELVSQNPLRERLHAQLMLALYRAGRQADALAAYTAARRVLREELGIEPGPALQSMQQDVLRRAPALELAPATSTFPINQLPPDIADFTGRRVEADRLAALLRDGGAEPAAPAVRTAVTVAVIAGPAGVGKTALGVHVGHLVAEDFPDGILYVNLRGAEEARLAPHEALGAFLRALGVPSDRVPHSVHEQSALFRSLTAGKRHLIVLDNAFDEAQVRPLIPGSVGCAVLVTSRGRLPGLAGAETVVLEVFSARESGTLLSRMLGAQRVHTEPGPADEVARLCGGLPLALRIAGARLAARPAWSIADLVRRLGDERERLAELAVGDLELRAAFESSYRTLAAEEQAMFRALGGVGSDRFDAETAAGLAGTDRRRAERSLDRLADAQLIQMTDSAEHYRLHDLVALFARSQAAAVR